MSMDRLDERKCGLVWLAYAVMSLVDGIGVLSDRTNQTSISSSLFFLWFALCPLPVAVLCARQGALRVLSAAMAVAVAACVCLGLGGRCAALSAAGFALAGLSNVALQVSVPVFVGEWSSPARLAGIVTGGLFVRTVVAVAFPFIVTFAASRCRWQLALAPFVVLACLSLALVHSFRREAVATSVARTSVLPALRRVGTDALVVGSVLAFAVAIIADVVFNLSVPSIIVRRFGGGGMSVGVVYAVWFGVKLPLMLLGSRIFLRYEAQRFFGVAILVATVGAAIMCLSGRWGVFLLGVGLFAAGFANVYGHVFGAAAPQHPDDCPAVSMLLVMAISAGALASPLLTAAGALGSRAPEGLVLALTAVVLPLAAFLSFRRGRLET